MHNHTQKRGIASNIARLRYTLVISYRVWGTRYDISDLISADIDDIPDIDEIETKNYWSIPILKF